ncbi:MAG TPA: DNA repair protein RecO [Bacteroidales bacterium]|nr:DNA repair protein RecO [Bacteroidales bacterium]
MLNKTRAIVLHQVKYGESSLIVTFYTEKFGRISGIVSGVKSKKSKIPAILFQPLTLLETDFYYRQNHTIQRLKEATAAHIYNSIPYNTSKSAVALFLAEVLYLSLQEEEHNPLLFSFVFHAFQLLDAKDENTSWFHHWFMLQLTRYLGFFPGSGTPATVSPVIHEFAGLSERASTALIELINSPQGPPDLERFGHTQRNELLERIIRYYTVHIEDFSRLKSWAVLQEVFKPNNT